MRRVHRERSKKEAIVSYNTYYFSWKERWILSLSAIPFLILLSYVFYHSYLAFLCMLPLAICYPEYKKKERIVKRKERLQMEFKEAILIISNLLSAGYSLETAFGYSVVELQRLFPRDSLMTYEIENINRKVCMNIPIERAIDEFALAADMEDIHHFAKVVKVAKRSGGELVGILKHSIDIISDKIAMKEEIITMTCAKRLEQKIMNIFPLFIIIYINFSAPDFFGIMYETIWGRMIMSTGLILYILTIKLSEHILQIEI